ncbi:hypothetical protein M409DRAFT_61618 [Zasmidium cellare ATCC 36951]|uniref:Uncharacterized protein n=1 Tax=Zasmidium cellare ATCC 36951 TaxID=1080233 RepID=A0A6A6BUL3_ZASCE|nr:uncharacterized protein M409DRAFT_61618 [Zasmidium cellare ATCC 36951]KAF2158484.1 hypothetical protein M409DRAFT_61618 [Zasmidium cellare ATCC 36951]
MRFGKLPPICIAIQALAFAKVSSADQCGSHVVQHTGFTFNITITDWRGSPIGGVSGSHVNAGDTISVASELPYMFEMTPGSSDGAAVSFKYAAWGTTSDDCVTDHYKNDLRHILCGFPC